MIRPPYERREVGTKAKSYPKRPERMPIVDETIVKRKFWERQGTI
nr:MAG TPA: hypothetical protein [Caudoviricetes sp.]